MVHYLPTLYTCPNCTNDSMQMALTFGVGINRKYVNNHGDDKLIKRAKAVREICSNCGYIIPREDLT